MTSVTNGDNNRNHSDSHHQQQQQPQRPVSSSRRGRPYQRQPPGPPPPPPPPPSHYVAAYSSSSSSAASLKGCCCCFFLLLTFLALLVIAVALVVALVVKPKKPQFDLQQVGVSYLLVTAPSVPSSPGGVGPPAAAYLTLNITMLFTAENPNKVGIRYGATAFTVMYRGVPLGVAELPGFEQPAHSTRLVQTRVVVDRVNVLQSDAMELVRDATFNDRVELRVAGDVGAKIRFLGVTSPRVQVSVDCAIVISPRKQSLTYKQCGVDGLNV